MSEPAVCTDCLRYLGTLHTTTCRVGAGRGVNKFDIPVSVRFRMDARRDAYMRAVGGEALVQFARDMDKQRAGLLTGAR